MPYKVRKVKGGFKVFRRGHALSRKPLTRNRARAQESAIWFRKHGR